MRINTVKFYLYDIIYEEKLIYSKNIKTVVFPRRDGAMYWPGNFPVVTVISYTLTGFGGRKANIFVKNH